MRKWAEVINKNPLPLEQEKLAAIDVTDDADGGVEVMTGLKATYGDSARYQFQYCRHDDKERCTIEPA